MRSVDALSARGIGIHSGQRRQRQRRSGGYICD